MAGATITLKGTTASDFPELTWGWPWGVAGVDSCLAQVLSLGFSLTALPVGAVLCGPLCPPPPTPHTPGCPALCFQQPYPPSIGSQHAATCLNLLLVPRPPWMSRCSLWHSGSPASRPPPQVQAPGLLPGVQIAFPTLSASGSEADWTTERRGA